MADAAIAPTYWQKARFPDWFQNTITVIHDGIDIDRAKPDHTATLRISDALTLTRDNEVITYVSRNLEPYRGYHRFMRALPQILQKQPTAHVVIIGGDGVSYGAPPDDPHVTWKQLFFEEIEHQLSREDLKRVHFLGQIPHADYLRALQISRAHIYLTYPFVLSWSLLEAMACECPIIASHTESVREVISPQRDNGVLIDFFDREQLAESVSEILRSPERAQRIGRNARQTIVENYSLSTCCLPAQLAWAESVARGQQH